MPRGHNGGPGRPMGGPMGGHHGGPGRPMGGPMGGHHRRPGGPMGGPMGGMPPHHFGGYRRRPYRTGCLGSFLTLILSAGVFIFLIILGLTAIF